MKACGCVTKLHLDSFCVKKDGYYCTEGSEGLIALIAVLLSFMEQSISHRME